MGGNTEHHQDQEWITIDPQAGPVVEEEPNNINETYCDNNFDDSSSEEELRFLNSFDAVIRDGIEGGRCGIYWGVYY